MIVGELELRSEALTDRVTARVLADAYEADGQLDRARLWRLFARGILPGYEHSGDVPPDLYARIRTGFQRVDPRRGAMMWLMRFAIHPRIATYRNLGAMFGISPERIRLYENSAVRAIRYAFFAERKTPTMRQTQRLEAAGALRGDTERIDFDALPPDDWPRVRSWVRMRTERGWVSFDARCDLGFPDDNAE